MKKQEMKDLIQTGNIETIVMMKRLGEGWKVFLHGNIPVRMREVLETAKGQEREFSSIDSAHSFIRECGYVQMIYIDG